MGQDESVFTPIHRQLGIEPTSGLTIDLIRHAIEARIPETGDLDWKSKFPDSRNHKDQEELAKDIAAMANSGGGWIVYGVNENDSAAGELTPIDWSATEQQRLFGLAYQKIGPPVTGLDIIPIPVDGGHVVAVEIPSSDQAPHLVYRDMNFFSAPVRTGPHTVFMSERELGLAYTRRHQSAAAARESLRDLYEQTVIDIGEAETVTGVFVARPHRPRQQGLLSVETADECIQLAKTTRLVQGGNLISTDQLRPGLRSRVAHGMHGHLRFSLHADGSITYTLRLEPVSENPNNLNGRPKKHQAWSAHVEGWASSAAALLRAHAQTLNVSGGYTVQCGLVPVEGMPIVLRAMEVERGLNCLINEDEMTPIQRFVPVVADVDPSGDQETYISEIASITLDVVNQGGVENLRLLPQPTLP